MSGTDVDTDALHQVAGMLRSSADGLESGAGSAPGAPQAGPMTALAAAALSHVSTSVGGLVEATSAAAQAVTSSAENYRGTEGSNAGQFGNAHVPE